MSNEPEKIRASKKLTILLNENRFDEFVAALSAGADVNHRFSEKRNNREEFFSVFELACRTPNRRAFIEQCICFGAELNKPTLDDINIFPIHLAAQSNDIKNLEALLTNQNIFVDQKSDIGQTALCMLFETITQGNYSDVRNCITLLLEYHANINTKNSIRKTPIQLVLENRSLHDYQKENIFIYCCSNFYCNVDENTKSTIQKKYCRVIIPEYTSQHELFDQLRDILNSETVVKFIAICQQKTDSITNLELKMIRRLLQITIHRGKLEATQKLLELKSEEGKLNSYSKLLEGLLKTCCVFGDKKILHLLLNVEPKDEVDVLNLISLINKNPLLLILVRQMGSKMEQFNNRFYECMEILLEDGRIEIDKRDGMNCTALELAGSYNNERAQRMLLTKGAYVGGSNLPGGHVLGTINLAFLQNHLDSCVTGSAKQLNSVKLEVNVINFVPPKFKSNYPEHEYARSNDKSFHDVLVALIEFMECDSSAKKIILHPVVLCLLNLKFYQLWFVHLMEVVFSTVLFLGLFWYASFFHEGISSGLLQILRLLFIFGTIVSVINLMIHVCGRCFGVKKLWVSRIIESGLELIVRTTSILYLLNYFGDEKQHVVGAYVILGSGIVVFLALRTIPFLSIGPNILKFIVVLINFLKYVITFGIVLVAFAMSFHVINSKKNIQNSNETLGPIMNHTSNASYSANSTVTHEDQYNTFANMYLALLKVAVMMTGEFNSSEMDLTEPFFAIMFTVFLFAVAIAFYNLLTGQAVRDVTVLKEESSMLGVKEKIIKLYEWNVMLQFLVSLLHIRENCFGIHINTTFQKITIELKPKDTIIKTISSLKPARSTVVTYSQETVKGAPRATSMNIIEETEYKLSAGYIITKRLASALKEIVQASQNKSKVD